MNDNERILFSILANSICSGTPCSECHDIFQGTHCPIDDSEREERIDFSKKVIALLQSRGIKEFSDDELLDILLEE